MKKSHALSLKDCFALLGIPEGSSLEDIKRAYRKRAFELHPDLNPGDGASRQFQQLNEAYVILIRLADSPSTKGAAQEASAAAAKTGHDTYRDQAQRDQERQRREEQEKARKEKEAQEKARRAKQEAERHTREAEARRVKDEHMRQEKERREEERRERLRQEIERQEADRLARQEKSRQDKERREEARRIAEQAAQEAAEAEARRTAEQPGSYDASARPHAAPHGESQASQPDSFTSFQQGGQQQTTAPDAGQDENHEAMLRDLLNDPFARRVYEDIYREVQSRKDAGEPNPLATARKQPQPDTRSPAEMAKNMGKAVKGWFRDQIDEEQELFFPASKLFPGARIRLQIRRGLGNEPKTVEITLPPDFIVGKPIRLRGMGKKIGKWQGDLYLTFQQKERNG